MSTYREDLHLGHKVPTTETDDIVNGAITHDKLANDSVDTNNLVDKCVNEPKLANNAVSKRTIQNEAVTEPKLADNAVSHRTIQPEAVHGNNIKPGEIDNKHLSKDSVGSPNIIDKSVNPDKLSDDVQSKIVLPITNQIDRKFKAITDELYSMIASLQVGGIALSNEFGDREDIGITQKALTKAIGKIWEAIQDPSHRVFDFALNVVPSTAYTEGDVEVTITADCSMAISDFDSIKIYVDDELVAQSSDITVFTTSHTISHTSEVKAVGMILGKTIEKTVTVNKEIPFFMGSGQTYTEIMNEECRKQLDGTLEGDYDLTVNNDGEHMFIIIPASRKNEFRRASMGNPDMGGYEIPLDMVHEDSDIVAYKSKAPDGYLAGTYNIDININS